MLDPSRAVVNRKGIVVTKTGQNTRSWLIGMKVASGSSRPRENAVYTLRPIDRINSSPLLFVTTPSRRR